MGVGAGVGGTPAGSTAASSRRRSRSRRSIGVSDGRAATPVGASLASRGAVASADGRSRQVCVAATMAMPTARTARMASREVFMARCGADQVCVTMIRLFTHTLSFQLAAWPALIW
jgi:hypothetical protein